MAKLALIAAVDARHGLGREGAMAWHVPEELALFKRLTLGCPVIVGYTTYLSLPKPPGNRAPLPGRHLIVLTRHARPIHPDVATVGSLDEAIALATRSETPTIWIAGGATVYHQAMPLADEIRLSKIEGDHHADVHFPPISMADWTITEEHDVPSRPPFRAITYARR